MSPRKSAAEAGKTRERILDHSVAVASVEGLQGLTLGRLAGDLGMSKAGVIGHFGSKEALQLATLDRGYAHFSRIVLDPVAGRPPGLARLRAIFDGWLQYLVSEREIDWSRSGRCGHARSRTRYFPFAKSSESASSPSARWGGAH
jgi:AcrR family transcriptional regulator